MSEKDVLESLLEERKPVLWRILVTQACIYRTISCLRRSEDDNSVKPSFSAILPREEIEKFYWSQTMAQEPKYLEELNGHLKAAQKYTERMLGTSI
jgi:hypothetical protein